MAYHRFTIAPLLASTLALALACCPVPIAAQYAGNGPHLPDEYLNIKLRYPGVYKITGSQLADAGAPLQRMKPANLVLYSNGTTVPLLVNAAENNHLTADDSLEFVGDSPRGDATWFLPDNKRNVYFLSWEPKLATDTTSSGQLTAKRAQPPGSTPAPEQYFWQWRHIEKNATFWFSTLSPDQTDNFYWFHVTADMKPSDALQVYLDFPGFAPRAGAPAEVDVHVLGATKAAGLSPSHKFRVSYNTQPAGTVEFDDVAMHSARFTLPPDSISDKPVRVTFAAPEERADAVDKIFVDWFNVRYPSRFDMASADFYQFNNNLVQSGDGTQSTSALLLKNLPAGSMVIDPSTRTAWQAAETQTEISIPNNNLPTTYTAAAPYARLTPDSITLVSTSTHSINLSADLQALVIYHPSVAATAASYTAYRNERGWNAAAVPVQTIFDSYSNGYISDEALKKFIGMVRGLASTLTHVVLIGDAHYDFREARTQDYPTQLDILIPIHWVYRPGVSWSGGYQDDNWYGSFDSAYRPDLAVGRIPVNDDAAGMEYLRKIIEYETLKKSKTDPGLMISSVERSFQDYVTEIATTHQDKLTSYSYLFPTADNASHMITNLLHEINAGKQLLYYVGHGGSLVWRVGPVDFTRQKDLFTPADVRKLTNKRHYPFIVCASCYTTAFDQAESIGEALVNQPAAGAIAVLGAPWKATVQESHSFNRKLFGYYFDPQVKTIGEASLRAHRDHIPADQNAARFNSFTLLGDPCLEIVR